MGSKFDPSQPARGAAAEALSADSDATATPLSPARQRLLALRTQRRRAAQAESADAVPRRADPAAPTACSFSQEALWIVERLGAGAGVYNVAQALHCAGALDVAALERALQALLERHEVLRTGFEEHDGVPLQRLQPGATAPLVRVDARHLAGPANQAALHQQLALQAQRPFDLARAPLLRASLWQLAPDAAEPEHVLLLVLHHLVADGGSMQVLARDLGALYARFSAAPGAPTPPGLTPLPVQFADWAGWQRDRLSGRAAGAAGGDLDYWRTKLAGLPTLAFATDLPRPPQPSYAGRSLHFAVPAAVLSRLRGLAREHNASLFMLLLTAFKALLLRYTGQDDVVVGAPVAGRDRPELEGLVGYFANSVVLRTDLSGNPSFTEALGRVRQTALEAYTHQALPFDLLVAALNPPRDLSRNPLYQVSFALNNHANHAAPARTLGGAVAQALPLALGSAKFDLALTFSEADGREPDRALDGVIEYSTDLFEAGTIARLAGHLQNLLAGVAADAGQRLASLPLLDDTERRQILLDGIASADPGLAAAAEVAVHTRIEQQALRTPDAVALRFNEQVLNYRDLNAQANQVAHHVRQLGAGPEVPVAVCLERSPRLVVALLGVLKAGAALLPLDPALPSERLAFMLRDSGAPLVLTESALADRFAGPEEGADRRLVCLDTQWREIAAGPDTHPAQPTPPAQLACVIYTSGSTGQPKGVLLEQRGWSHHLLWMQRQLGVEAMDRFVQITSIGFDAALVELFLPLQAGASLVLAPPGEQRDSAGLARLMRDQGVTILQMVPTALRDLLAEPGFEAGRLRHVICGGEALAPGLADALQRRLPHTTLGNFYGPTETSIDASHFELPRPLPGAAGSSGAITIGRPIANAQCYVLDAHLQPVPVGVTGELLIGGIGLARGYLNRPELTRERFIADPFAPGERLYRSGDLARFRPDGNLDWLGRADTQVKIRGHRIELGEVEAGLTALPGVRQAVVVASDDAPGGTGLVAYVVMGPDASGDTPADLKRRLALRLPDAMLPSVIVVLPELPRLANGKLDRRALPSIEPRSAAASPPATAVEHRIWALWRDVLARDDFGVHANFFALGGHSLLATRLIARLRSALQVELPLRVLFEAPTVAGLAQRVERAGAARAAVPAALAEAGPGATPRLTPQQRRGLLPLSSAQRRMAFWQELSPGAGLYNLPVVLDLHGPLDATLLQDGLRSLMQRHELLRTRWVDADGQRWQRIADATPWRLEHLALDPNAAPAAALEQATAQEASREFDLRTEAPMRARLIAQDRQRHRLVWTLHHSVCDGRSVEILLGELSALYSAAVAGQPAALAEPALQYTDHAAWEPQRLAGVRERELGYWLERLSGAPTSVDLPTDHRRPAHQRFAGATVGVGFSPEQGLALHALAQRTGTTLFMVALALWQTLLHRYSGQPSVVTGSVGGNRGRRELEGVVGCFANTLALRSDFPPGLTVAELLAQVKETTLGALAHQQLPFDEVVDALKLARDGSRMPLVQTFVVLQAAVAGELHLGPVRAHPVALASPVAKFDLSLDLQQRGTALEGAIEYDTALFERASVLRMAGHLRNLAEAMCADPDQPVASLALLGSAERRLILSDWNRTEQPYPLHIGVQTLVEQQALRTPQACAVVFGDKRLSYAQLNARANRLAHRLVTLGAGPEVLVGVCLERSLYLPVALLAVLKAGAAFVPLDPELPAARLALLLADTAAPLVLTQSHLLARLPAAAAGAADPAPTLLCLDQPGAVDADSDAANPPCRTGPQSLAYVIFTSGSTGGPKGVLSLHQGLSNHILWLAQTLAVTQADRLLQKTTISFDAAVWEFFTPWQAGATLVLAAPGEHRDPQALVRTLRDQLISIVQFVPSALRALLDEPGLAGCAALRYVVSGGEALEPDLVRAFRARLPAATLANCYGPSEASDDATHGLPDLSGDGAGNDSASVPIGRPIANVQCYVLDAQWQPLPIGAAGELFIGGAGLARGYLNRPELTAERFVAHPFAPGERLYRTGDRARWRADGQIEFLGRIDFQVKIRGQRIELGEIEATLNAQPGVHQAVVVARADAGMTRLVAYVVGQGQALEPAALKTHLAGLLPESMLPSAWVVLPALPTLANGKIDRQALPAPRWGGAAATRVAPRTPTERVAWEVWREVLRTAEFGVHDNFFELGGQSLLATQVMSRLRAALRIELPLQVLFDAPTVAGLALQADQAALAGIGPNAPIPARGHDGAVPLSAVQRSMWLAEQVEGQHAAYHMPSAERLVGRLDVAALGHALRALAQRHDSLRLCIGVQAGVPLQRLDDAAALRLECIDLSALPDGARQARLRDLLKARSDAPFDLAVAPLGRVLLIRLAPEEHVLQLVLHHLVSDGGSAQLLRHDLASLYQAFTQGRPAPPRAGSVGYLDYAAWEAQRIASGALAPHLRYWTERLQGLVPLNLPFVINPGAGPGIGSRARARSRASDVEAVGGDGGAVVVTDPCLTLSLPPEVAHALAALALRGSATLFMLYVAAFKLLLMRWCDQPDVAVGTPIARRDRPELADLVGPLLNTLVLRTDLSGDPSFEALLARVRDTALQAYRHQEQPFDGLVAALNPARIEGRNPLFDVLVNALPDTDERQGELPLAGLSSTPIEADLGPAKFAITLYIGGQPGASRFALHYRGALFAPGQMAALLDQYGHLLAQIAARPGLALSDYSLVTAAARAVLADPLAPLRRVAADVDSQPLFADFLASVATQPNAQALRSAEGDLSYAELEQLSRRLAGWLMAQGIVPGDRVAIHAERCPGLVVAVLGVARAGALFCILDNAYPDERNQDCLAQLAPRRVLVCGNHVWAGPARPVPTQRIAAHPQAMSQDLFRDLRVAEIRLPEPEPRASDAPLPSVDPHAPAYVSFTSGTSGRPKGIVTAHAPLRHFVGWHVAQHGLLAQDRFSMLCGLAHDPLLRDIFTPLAIGAALCVPASSTLQHPDRLVDWLAAQQVSVAHLTPALGDVIVTGHDRRALLNSLRHVFWGGELLTGRSVEQLRAVAPRAVQVNFYGATETPQAMAHWAVPAGRAAHLQPVGRGIAGVQLLLLRANATQAGIGESAEIWIRTPHLSLGYLDDPASTRARFVRNPYSGAVDDLCYRTGDLGRCDSDGNVVVLGRIDDQVNVRGMRIEPAEIERVAESLPGVERAIVKTAKDASGQNALLLFYTCQAGVDVSAAAVEVRVRKALPNPMWPRAVRAVAGFARLPNGKIDLRALPDALQAGATPTVAHDPPRGAVETGIARVWQELLALPQAVGRQDNFFDLGGHSLLALRAVFAIGQRCGLRLDMRRLVHESLAQLAAPEFLAPLPRLGLPSGATQLGVIARIRAAWFGAPPPRGAADAQAIHAAPPPPETDSAAADDAAASESIESVLGRFWSELLTVPNIAMDDDFFALGGHSLLAIRLLAEIEKTFGVELSVATLFQAPTPGQLAAVIQRQGVGPVSRVIALQPLGARARLFAVPGYGGAISPFRALAGELGTDQPLYVLATGGLGRSKNRLTLEALAHRLVADMRALQPTGPYHLVGYSLGGRIVFEMAQQLRRAGQAVGLLALLDCAVPGYPAQKSFVVRGWLHWRHGLALGPSRAWHYLARRAWNLRKYAMRIHPKLFDGAPEAALPAARGMQRSADAVYDAWSRYRPGFYPGSLLLVRAEARAHQPGLIDSDPEMGWGPLVGGGVRLASLDCAHAEMLNPENAPALASVLAGALAEGLAASANGAR